MQTLNLCGFLRREITHERKLLSLCNHHRFCYHGPQNRNRSQGRYTWFFFLTVCPAVCGETSRGFWPGSLQVLPASWSVAVQSVRNDQVTYSRKGCEWVGENDFRAVGEIPPVRCQKEGLLLSDSRAAHLLRSCTGIGVLKSPVSVDRPFFRL